MILIPSCFFLPQNFHYSWPNVLLLEAGCFQVQNTSFVTRDYWGDKTGLECYEKGKIHYRWRTKVRPIKTRNSYRKNRSFSDKKKEFICFCLFLFWVKYSSQNILRNAKLICKTGCFLLRICYFPLHHISVFHILPVLKIPCRLPIPIFRTIPMPSD